MMPHNSESELQNGEGDVYNGSLDPLYAASVLWVKLKQSIVITKLI